MSELPAIDPLKVAQRKVLKLSAELEESKDNETKLEILAETLRDERDEYKAQLDDALRSVAQPVAAIPVENITTLP